MRQLIREGTEREEKRETETERKRENERETERERERGTDKRENITKTYKSTLIPTDDANGGTAAVQQRGDGETTNATRKHQRCAALIVLGVQINSERAQQLGAILQ